MPNLKKSPVFSSRWRSPQTSLGKGERFVCVWRMPKAGPAIITQSVSKQLEIWFWQRQRPSKYFIGTKATLNPVGQEIDVWVALPQVHSSETIQSLATQLRIWEFAARFLKNSTYTHLQGECMLPTWALCSACLASIRLFLILSGQSRLG